MKWPSRLEGVLGEFSYHRHSASKVPDGLL